MNVDQDPYHLLFPDELISWMQVMIDSRLVTVRDINHRNQVMLPTYKVGSTAEMTQALLACLHCMPALQKRALISALERTMDA